MAKIIIDVFENTSFIDVYASVEGDTIEFKQGLDYKKAVHTIYKFISKYKLSDNDMIINNVYDHNEYLKETIKQTVKEYKN